MKPEGSAAHTGAASRRGGAAETSRKGFRGAKGDHGLQGHGGNRAGSTEEVYTVSGIRQGVNGKLNGKSLRGLRLGL